MREVIVVLCADTEPDSPFFGSSRYNVRNPIFSWKGVLQGIPAVTEEIKKHKDSFGESAKITCFIRADEMMGAVLDQPAYMFRAFEKLWNKLAEEGNEIGWHCHLFRWDNQNSCWKQEIQDHSWMGHCLESAYFDIQKAGFTVASSRMGWNYHNNVTMGKLDSLGINVDLSSIPGSVSHGKFQDIYNKTVLTECHDWSGCPRKPFFPSSDDYKKDGSNRKRLSILEIPVSAIPNIRQKKPKYWVIDKGLSVSKFIIDHVFRETMQYEQRTFLVGCMHSDEVVLENLDLFKRFFVKRVKGLRLLNIRENLEYINKLSRQMGVPFRFATATCAASIFKADYASHAFPQISS